MAKKLVHLMFEGGKFLEIPHQVPASNPLLSKVITKYNDCDFARKAMETPEASTVVEELVPKVMKLDQDGVPVSRQTQFRC